MACFNPCCFGSLVRAFIGCGVKLVDVGFQSLLFWIIGSGSSRALSVTLVFVWGLFLVRQSWTQWCVQGSDLR